MYVARHAGGTYPLSVPSDAAFSCHSPHPRIGPSEAPAVGWGQLNRGGGGEGDVSKDGGDGGDRRVVVVVFALISYLLCALRNVSN